MSEKAKTRPLFDPPIVKVAILDSFRKLRPRQQLRNPPKIESNALPKASCSPLGVPAPRSLRMTSDRFSPQI